MPTGYTWGVANGEITELEPFVWQVARGMGALITMRDEPPDAPVPDRFEPSQYHAKQLAEARQERDRIRAMTADEAANAAAASIAEYERDKAQAERENAAQRARYEAMLAKVNAWSGAPEGIREFAIRQLHDSIEHDCPVFFHFYRDRPSGDGEEWRAAKLAKLERDILYHAKAQAEEEERTEQRNLWMAQLRRSLAAQVGTHPKGGDAKQAPGASLSDAVAGGHVPLPPIDHQEWNNPRGEDDHG